MDKTGSLTEYVPEAHEIVIEGQRRARITGVVDVESFHEEEAAILTEAGLLTCGQLGHKLKNGAQVDHHFRCLKDNSVQFELN